jgi:hypothetical protein
VGDFNGDGLMDVAVPSWTGAKVTVLLGKGNGGFRIGSSLAVGNKPSWVAVADVNGDGFLDLAVSNAGDATVSVLLGNGDGTFQAQKPFSVRTKPVYVVAADFNGDKRPDLAVVNQLSNSVSILLGVGDGTFRTATNYTTGQGTSPVSAVAGDFIGNGRLDLAFAASGNNTVAVMLNHGDGTFSLPLGYAVGSTPSAVAEGDFNNDGFVDLAVTNSKASTVSVLLGNGNGTFNTATNFPTGAGPLSVVVQDLNGDGKADLAVGFSGIATGATNGISILAGNGDGTFQTHVDHATKFLSGALTEAVAVADFNGDGSPDLVAADALANIVSVFLNTSLASPFPSKLAFGSQAVGTSSNPKTVTLNNSGSAILQVSGVTITGDFSQTNTCTAPVDPGTSCSISVVFTPTQTGARTGVVTITDNSPTGTQAISLAGTGR